jgi:hypothetical protein
MQAVACAGLGCASLGGASVALQSTGEPERIFIAGPIFILSAVVWFASAWRFLSRPRTAADMLFFLFLLTVGVIASLASGYNFPGGDYFHKFRGFPWYWLRLGEAAGGGPLLGGPDARSLLGDIVFWAGVSIVVFWLLVAARRQRALG